MKRAALLLIVLFTCIFSFAQLKPEAGSFGLGFRLNGILDIGFSKQDKTELNDVMIMDFSNPTIYGKPLYQ